jgi:predicted nucleic acid-binding protein
MILVDTSVLIDYLRGTENQVVAAFDRILEQHMPYGINEFIYLEILQGARTEKEYRKLQEYFATIPFYSLGRGKESFEQAAYLNFACRRSGVMVRSTIDLLVVQTAIENNLFLLHNDSDFTNMAKAIKELKIFKIME